MKKKTGGRLSLRGGCFGSTGGRQSLQHRPTFPPTCFAKTKPMRKNILPPISFKKKLCIKGKKCDFNNAGKTSLPIFLTKICHFFTDMSVISLICSMSDGNIHCQKEKEVDDQIKGTVSGPLKRAREWYLR